MQNDPEFYLKLKLKIFFLGGQASLLPAFGE